MTLLVIPGSETWELQYWILVTVHLFFNQGSVLLQQKWSVVAVMVVMLLPPWSFQARLPHTHHIFLMWLPGICSLLLRVAFL